MVRARDMVRCYVSLLAQGLGGGLVIDGCLQHGTHGLAGSIGQVKISLDGEGHVPLENYVSGPGLALLYNERTHSIVSSGQEVAERVASGDEDALEAIHKMGALLGIGLSHVLHMYDVSCVVIGGSVAQIGEELLDSTRNSLAQYGHATVAHTPIFPAKFGPDAGLIGAAIYARQ